MGSLGMTYQCDDLKLIAEHLVVFETICVTLKCTSKYNVKSTCHSLSIKGKVSNDFNTPVRTKYKSVK